MVFILCGRHSATAVVQKERGERKGYIHIHRNWHAIMILALRNSNKTHTKCIKTWLTSWKTRHKLWLVIWDWMNVPNVPLSSVQGWIFFSNFTNGPVNISLHTICEWHEFGKTGSQTEIGNGTGKNCKVIQRRIPCRKNKQTKNPTPQLKIEKSSICLVYKKEDGKRSVVHVRNSQWGNAK